MDGSITHVRQYLEDAHLLLITIERQNGQIEAKRLIQDVEIIFRNVDIQLERINSMVQREPATSKRLAYQKMEQLQSDVHLTRGSFSTVKNRFENQCKMAKDREELLTRRFTTNNETRVNLGFDHELDTNDRLKKSGSFLDEMLAQGVGILEDLEKQKGTLFGIRKKFQYFTKTLGLSDTTIKLIGKRVKEDKKIFWCGVTLCIIFMMCFYLWWKGYF